MSARLTVAFCLLSVGAYAQRVGFVAQGPAEEVEAMRLSLAGWLATGQLQLAEDANVSLVATVHAEWSDEGCTVEVFNEEAQSVRRTLVARVGDPVLLADSAALVAASGVREVMAQIPRRPRLGAPPAPAPALVQETVTGAAPPSLSLSLGAFVQGRAFGRAVPVAFGGGASLTASWTAGPWRPSAQLVVAYNGPIRRDSPSLSLQVQGAMVRALGGVGRSWGAWHFSAGLGGGADLLVAQSTSTQVPSEFIRGTRVDLAPFFVAAIGVEWHVSRSAGIFLRALVDIDPAPRRYLSVIGGEREMVLEPWPVRPAVQLGATFDLVGQP